MARGTFSCRRSFWRACLALSAAGCGAGDDVEPADGELSGHLSGADWDTIEHGMDRDRQISRPAGREHRMVLAARRFHLGRNAPNGRFDAAAWRNIGLDLDGVATNDPASATCAAARNATFDRALADGNDGRDNSFAKNVLPMFQLLAGSAERRTNADVQRGDHTLLFSIRLLGRAPAPGDLSADFFDTAPFDRRGEKAQPAFDGLDIWSPTFECMDPRRPRASRAHVEQGDFGVDAAGRTWTGASDGVLRVRIAVSRAPDPDKVAHLRVHRPRAIFHLPDGGQSGTGTLAGFLRPAEVHAELRRVMALYNPGACVGEHLDGVCRQIEKAIDIREDGLVDPAVPCDAISFGADIEVVHAILGLPAPPAAPPKNVCE